MTKKSNKSWVVILVIVVILAIVAYMYKDKIPFLNKMTDQPTTEQPAGEPAKPATQP